MPHSSNYTPIIPLISTPRLNSYRITFKTTSDVDLYGVYIWAQHASASLYPLTQNLEITLRNAIDCEAKRRFGQYWWNTIAQRPNKQAQANLFLDNIAKAKSKLTKDWTEKERNKLGLPRNSPIPTPIPTWTHDQIIAATEFSTWQFILVDAFDSPHPSQNSNFLWPISTGKAFKNYANITPNAGQIRSKLINLIKELRDYRNRLFHHEPIWIKDPSVIDSRTAINTIRQKINKIELLINAVDTRKLKLLEKVGLLAHTRRICAEAELNIYRYLHADQKITRRAKRTLRSITSRVRKSNETATWSYNNEIYGVYKIR